MDGDRIFGQIWPSMMLMGVWYFDIDDYVQMLTLFSHITSSLFLSSLPGLSTMTAAVGGIWRRARSQNQLAKTMLLDRTPSKEGSSKFRV